MIPSKMANGEIKNISDAVTDKDETSVFRIDSSIIKLNNKRNHQLISNLLCLLNDDFDFQEGMWSIIHYSESFDSDVYIEILLTVLDKLNSNAPEWSDRLVSRVLNSKNYTKVLEKKLSNTSSENKNALVKIFDRINNDYSGKFDGEMNNIKQLI